MLILSKDRHFVSAASENATEFLSVPMARLLGSPIEDVLTREVLRALQASPEIDHNSGLLTYIGTFAMAEGFFSVVTHCVGEEFLVEFERQDRLVSPELTNRVITNFVTRLSSISEEEELCSSITRQVKELTEFNRVLLYRFDEFGHGLVLTEENDGALPSYVGLRFPASDIPRQARDLYVLNTVRVIPNATYEPSPLCAIGSRGIRDLDLSMSLLRSVSPIHLQYMRNMGTVASMSISIVCEGRLWGLISGHHPTPKTVPYLVRSACDLLAKLVSTQMISLRAGTKLRAAVHFHALQRQVLTEMAIEKDHLRSIANHLASLVRATDAAGAALLIDGECTTSGSTPDAIAVQRLADWLETKARADLFHSDHLSNDVPWATEIQDTASGLVAIRISDVRQGYLMWFRPEVLRTVSWAGQRGEDKVEPVLEPRKSFESWKELVRGQSEPWSEMEVESALDFRSAVVTIGLKRAEEAVKLGESRFLELTRALPNLVWTADDTGRLTYVNQRWLDQGFGREGFWFEQERILPEDEQRCRELWVDSAARGMPFVCELHFLGSADNAERWNAVFAIPYMDADDRRAGWVGTCTDTTDRRRRELAMRMTEKLALTGRMTSVIAHEINNPLEAIGNILYLLGQRTQNDSESKAYIALAESELLRISGITKQTLRWSTDSIQEAETGVIADLFSNVLKLYAGQIRNRQVNIERRGNTALPFYGRAGQLTQVLANLISNAVQAVKVGGTIWLETSVEGETLQITVRDDGHGMSIETQRNLFEPFFTTKGNLGNGLGLYISREIVEGHGGRLDMQSQAGLGTSFSIHLPLSAPN